MERSSRDFRYIGRPARRVMLLLLTSMGVVLLTLVGPFPDDLHVCTGPLVRHGGGELPMGVRGCPSNIYFEDRGVGFDAEAFARAVPVGTSVTLRYYWRGQSTNAAVSVVDVRTNTTTYLSRYAVAAYALWDNGFLLALCGTPLLVIILVALVRWRAH